MKFIVLEIVLLLAMPMIAIWIALIMFYVGDMAADIQTIVDFIEASPTPGPE